MNTLMVLITGVLLRLVIPLALTALLVIVLRRMDARWQNEAEVKRSLLARDDQPCWKEQGLSVEEIRARAEAGGKPCWQLHRLSNGYLRQICLECEVFIHAPIPVELHSKAHV